MKNIYLLIISAICLFSSLHLTAKELRWAADAEGNAPFIFQDPNNPNILVGFEVDIANSIARELGRRAVHIQNQWDGLIPGLNRDDYDIVLNGIEIMEDRKEVVNFSIPYYYTFEQLVVRSDQEGIASLSDLYNKTVGCLKNSLAERILIASGGMNIRSYEGEVNAFEDLKNGRLEAVLVDAPIALYYASWNPDLKSVGKPIGEVAYAIALRKQDTILLNEINEALHRLIEAGEIKSILARWNLWNELMAVKWNDWSRIDIEPVDYLSFIAAQGAEKNFITMLERYISFMPLFAQAAMITLGLSVISMIIAIVLGLIIAMMRIYGPKPISWLAMIFIEVVRGTPLLIQLFFIFYALPSIGITFSPFVAAIIGLGINYAAYEAENYRAGLFSVPKGQMEAAISLGMKKRQALKTIIFPQAFRIVIPPVTNDFISLLKDSSLVSVITMVELTKVYNQVASTYYDFLGTGIIVAAFYLLLGLPFVKLSKKAEQYFSIDKVKK